MHDPALRPHEECRRRLAENSAHVRRLTHRLDRFIRIKRFVIYATIGYSVVDPTATMLLIPLAILLPPAVVIQNRIASAHHRAQRVVEFYRGAVARIDDRWPGRGDSGARFLDADHLFAGDLDLFGEGSLFQFLNVARTSVGSQMLADWLTHPAGFDEIRRRQAAVRELSSRLDVRESLAIVDPDPGTFRLKAVDEWGRAPDPLRGPVERIAGIALLAAAVVSATLWWRSGQSVWLVVAVVVECGFYVRCRERLSPVSECGYYALKTRACLSDVRGVLRRVDFEANQLSEIQSAIDAGGARSMLAPDALYGFVAQVPPLLLIACRIVPDIDRWRRATAMRAQAGLAALGELEALASLAQFAWERTDAVFPTIVDSAPCFEACELGHPLIPARDRVKNDLQLNESLRLLMVSGSNMSGKSTMLRTVGVNAVLALCGGAVCARQLRISPFSIGTAMRFGDSLQQKASHFYAVITRLSAVMKLQKHRRPLLFLFDEILQGTNSRDRFAGADAIVRKLVDRGGVGLVTTHDLELTRIVDTLASRAANVHFVDRIVDGEIHFDYKMRPGVVQTTNALALMRGMGLDV